jgi:CRP-like cAMP-binding protein
LIKLLAKYLYDPQFEKKKAFLKSLELFKDLKDKDLGHLAQALHSRTYHEGEVLFLEGDIGRALFILESGAVELSRQDSSGSSRQIYILKPGDFFGEMALLEHLPRTAKALAMERSHLFLLYRSKLEAILHYYPRVGVSIMTHIAQLLSARLRHQSTAPTLCELPPQSA